MKVKSFVAYQLKHWLPGTFAYLLLLGLVELLVTFYRVPQAFFFDVVRFSLPLMIIWALADVLRSWHRVQKVSHDQDVLAADPVQVALITRQRRHNKDSQALIKKLRIRQQSQLDQMELYSHEIKNSLTSLQAAAENHPQVASQVVLSAVHSANYHLNMMLGDERLAMDDNDFDFEWVDLSALVTGILKDNSAIFINLQLQPQLTSLDGVHVLTDRKWLRFCLVQLLSNAIKYSAPGSTIELKWSGHQLQIIDHGCGIAASDLPRIYDNGFSGHNGHQTTKSTGMGLYLVKKVTQQLNFSVSVASTIGQGTTASLNFLPTNVRQS